MDEKLKKEEQQDVQPAEKQTAESLQYHSLEEAVAELDEFGGFDVLSTTLDGAENLDPSSPAMKDIFLSDEDNAEEREKLKNRLNNWIALLVEEDNVGEMIEKSVAVSEKSQELLNGNVKRALDASRKLEENYRTVAAFFRNAVGDKPLKNLTIVNAPLDKIIDLENPRFLKAVSEEFQNKYDRLDLMNNYSLLIIPGFLESKTVLDEWARAAHDNKVTLVTDFRNLESPDQVMKLFEKAKLTGADAFRSNVIMTCNWLVGRGAFEEVGEKDAIYLPPSAALAGRIYANNIAQVSAGKKYGVLRGIEGARFVIRANDLADLGDMGLVPMVYEYGQVQAFSAKTLFNGSNLGLQTSSVVRTFDWLTKSMMDYLNRMLFQNISTNMEMDIHNEISNFFNKCQREYKIIEKFSQVKVKRDPTQRDRVFVNVYITPFFPAKNFIIKLDGKGGEDPDWTATMEE